MGTENFSLAQLGAVVVGITYVLAGVIGFPITGFGDFTGNTGDTLLSFDVNPFHNTFHIVAGAYLVFVAFLGRTVTEGALIGGGVVYLVAAGLGFLNRLQILSINDAFATDQFLHLATGVVALLLGLYSTLTNRTESSRNPVQRV